MVLADRRFQKKRAQLPKWINQAMLDSDTNLSTDMAVASAKRFLRTMAQPFGGKEQDGVSTWTLTDLERHKEKIEEGKISELRGEEGYQRRNGATARGDGRGVETGFDDEFGDAGMDIVMMEMET